MNVVLGEKKGLNGCVCGRVETQTGPMSRPPLFLKHINPAESWLLNDFLPFTVVSGEQCGHLLGLSLACRCGSWDVSLLSAAWSPWQTRAVPGLVCLLPPSHLTVVAPPGPLVTRRTLAHRPLEAWVYTSRSSSYSSSTSSSSSSSQWPGHKRRRGPLPTSWTAQSRY